MFVRLQFSVKKVLVTGFLLWFILTGASIYFLHFNFNLQTDKFLQYDNFIENYDTKKTQGFEPTISDKLLLKVDQKNEVTSVKVQHIPSNHDQAYYNITTSTDRIQGAQTPHNVVHRASKLSSTEPTFSVEPPTAISRSVLQNRMHQSVSQPESRWEDRILFNGKNLKYSSSKTNMTDYIRLLTASRMVLKYRRWYKSELKVANQYCTNKTCVILSDTLPDSSVDVDYYYQIRCFKRAIEMLQKSVLLTNKSKDCTCHLHPATVSSKVVGLVSLPGSGNTWVRGLLEEATRVCTGSMWCDTNLRATQFCAEGVRGTRTLVVKNHDPLVRWRGQSLPHQDFYTKLVSGETKPEFDAVVFLHRDPYRAIIAEHHRAVARSLWNDQLQLENYTNISSNDHVLFFGKQHFGKTLLISSFFPIFFVCFVLDLLYFSSLAGNNSVWNETVYRLAGMWKAMVNHLLVRSSHRPVLLIHFEDLKHNVFNEIKRVLAFIGYSIEDALLRDRLKHNFNAFYRNHSDSFKHFTPEQNEHLNNVISSIDPHIATKLRIAPRYGKANRDLR